MPRIDNLKPFTSQQSREEAAKNGHKGGIASGKAKRERKQMRETMEKLLAMTINNGRAADVESIRSLVDMKGKNITAQDALCASMIKKAIGGNVNAALFVRDMVGENPVLRVDADVKSIVPIIGGEDRLED